MLQARLKVPQPIRSAESLESNGGFKGLTPQQMSARTLFFGDGGRRHTEEPRSDTYQFKPGRRKLYPGPSDYERPGGLKKLPHPVPKVPPRAEQRHIPSAAMRSGYDVPEHSIEKALNRKVAVRREDGLLARDFISTEVTLDKAFGVKVKCNGGIRQQRNGIPMANPGDKLYSAVEYSPGFYKEFNSDYSRVGGREGTGGKVGTIAPPGEAAAYEAARDTSKLFNPASMTHTMGRQDTLNFRPRLSYEERMRMKATREAIEEVEELTVGKISAMNEDGLSWEDKTGLFVWKTKAIKEKEKKREEAEAEEKKE